MIADFCIAVDHRGPVTVLRVTGEIDIYTAPRLRQTSRDLTDLGHHELVLDLTQLTFTDSTGLSVMVGARKRLIPLGGRVVLAAVPQNLARVLRITGLTKVFPVYATADEAVAALCTIRPAT